MAREKKWKREKEDENGLQAMPKCENLRPVGVMVNTLSLQVRDSGTNPLPVHFQSSCACLDP